ncbi:MAG TPA: ATP-binding protein [Rickettsiales bacterium]|nr:ATP-binding protein [Rickettsiales bacterium]
MSELSLKTFEYSEFFNTERERIQRQMFLAISHDLKTPLASIIGSLDIYMHTYQKLSPETQLSLLNTALQQAVRLDNFITNILDMSKLESGMVKPHKQSFDLLLMLQECIITLSPTLQNSSVHLHEIPEPVLITSDRLLLHRVIFLLLDNAVKYGGRPSVIHISYGVDEAGDAYIHVQDNGKGIESARMEEIFSKYTRFVKSDRQVAGTGLGLPISREIMRLLNGTVTVTNHKDNGSVFTVRLPVQ